MDRRKDWRRGREIGAEMKSHNQTLQTERELYEADFQRTKESVEKARDLQDRPMTLRVKSTSCDHGAWDMPVDSHPPAFVKHVSARCPECPSDSFPQLHKILRVSNEC